MARKAQTPTVAQPDDGPDLDPAWRDRIRSALVAWYAGAARPLPWRVDADPYRILVSETMLVQTTVVAVVPFFERFLARFPGIQALADADDADVVKAWEGLGYYRRARQLHAAARAIVRDHGGIVPDDAEALRALPGVGPYIAGAILSFAFGRPAPILEANTQRVLARWLAWKDDVRSTRSQARLWAAAARIVPDDDPATFNQAFIELGALVCSPRQPMCLTCPVSTDCRARQTGMQDTIPVIAPKAAPLEVSEACVVATDGDRVLVVKRGPGVLWEGFWEFPTIHLTGPDPARRSFDVPVALTEGVRRISGVSTSVGPAATTFKYSVTKHRVTLAVHLARHLDGQPAPGAGLVASKWATFDELAALTMGSATRRVVAWLGKSGNVALRG